MISVLETAADTNDLKRIVIEPLTPDALTQAHFDAVVDAIAQIEAREGVKSAG